jgi:hypothetical protein
VSVVPIDAVATHEGRLRLLPTRNQQRRGIRLAEDFEIGRWTDGSLATLVAAA